MYRYFTLIGRFFLAALFLGSAIGKITDPAGTQYFMALFGMPLVEPLMWASVAVELAGALGLLFGWQARWAALALALWLVPVTLIFHTSWADPMQVKAFMGNLGLMGGLLFISGTGAGAFSLDRLRDTTARTLRGILPATPTAGISESR